MQTLDLIRGQYSTYIKELNSTARKQPSLKVGKEA